MKTMTKHLRYVVDVSGKVPLYRNNIKHYTRIIEIAEKLATECAEEIIASSKLREQKGKLVEIICPNRSFAEELGDRILKAGKYKEVGIHLRVVQLA